MSIKSYGNVIVTEDDITISNFHFESNDFITAQQEAIDWAIKRLQDKRPTGDKN